MPKSPERQTAALREERRVRMIIRLEEGASYEQIGREEGLSRDRVRRIIGAWLRSKDEDKQNHTLVQAARLEPALRLALRAISAGRLEAIDRLLKVQERQDKYIGPTPGNRYDPRARDRLMAKINRVAARLMAEGKESEGEAAEGEAAPAIPAPALDAGQTPDAQASAPWFGSANL